MIRGSVNPFCFGLVALLGVLLIAQDCPAQSSPCDPDPCPTIPNAVAGTCTAIGGSCTPGSDFTCDCETGSTWLDAANTCLGPMAQIPAGCFDMGDHFGEEEADELPVHNVCIMAFEMDVHEVTNAEYAECVADGGCTPPFYSCSFSRPTYYGDPTYNDFPVVSVDWFQASDYCTWAGKRLPTEAEWEYAARGGLAGKRYPWGGDSPDMEDDIDCDDANWGKYTSSFPCWDHCHSEECDNDTHPVGNYAANGFGLHDMTGNVMEWASDWYEYGYYSISPSNDPAGPASGTYRVLRGGSWSGLPIFLRVASRYYYPPDRSNINRGIRCARGGAHGP